MTLAEFARDAAAALVRSGRAPDESRRDVAVLAQHILGWDAATWLTRQRDAIPSAWLVPIDALIERRAAGEPVAYLTGEKEFYGRPFTVTSDVLIPRPETELIVEIACARIDRRPASDVIEVLDVGTGSGCIAVTLAAERAHVHVTATDVSLPALVVAAANASRHGVASRIDFGRQALAGDAQAVDLVVTNPPYVPERDKDTLARDVREYEPALALFGGHDGLDVIGRLIPDAWRALRPGGTLIMEIGMGQFDAVASLLDAAGFTPVTPHHDLAGIIRVVEAERRGDSV